MKHQIFSSPDFYYRGGEPGYYKHECKNCGHWFIDKLLGNHVLSYQEDDDCEDYIIDKVLSG